MILGAPGTPIAGFNQDAWFTSGHYDKREPRKSVEQFRAFREANLALIKSLTPEQWKHHGVHSERGEETVEHIVRMFAGHDLNHIQQIERILAPAKMTSASLCIEPPSLAGLGFQIADEPLKRRLMRVMVLPVAEVGDEVLGLTCPPEISQRKRDFSP